MKIPSGSEVTNSWLTGDIRLSPQQRFDKIEDDPISATTEEDSMDNQGMIPSKVFVHASSSGTGLMNRYFYRFTNVQLGRDKLTVYYNPEEFAPPEKPLWVDMVSGNATTHDLPTMFVIKGDAHDVKW